MPGFFTHYLFGWNTRRQFSSTALSSQLSLHPAVYSLGLQGPDLFSYHPWLLSHKRRNLADACHTRKTGAFFAALLQAASALPPSEERAVAFVYLLGFLGHYVLDAQCHPYVYAKAAPIHPLTKSFGVHLKLEADFDRILLEECQGKPRFAVRQDQLISPTHGERKVIVSLLQQAVAQTYPEMKVSTSALFGSITLMCFFCRGLRDPKGYKRKLVWLSDHLIFHHDVLSPLVAGSAVYFEDPMNRAHRPWHNYWHPDQVSTASVDDLMVLAGQRFAALYEPLCGLFDQTVRDPAPLLEAIGNRSYHSGEELPENND